MPATSSTNQSNNQPINQIINQSIIIIVDTLLTLPTLPLCLPPIIFSSTLSLPPIIFSPTITIKIAESHTTHRFAHFHQQWSYLTNMVCWCSMVLACQSICFKSIYIIKRKAIVNSQLTIAKLNIPSYLNL